MIKVNHAYGIGPVSVLVIEQVGIVREIHLSSNANMGFYSLPSCQLKCLKLTISMSIFS
jgi:hypothetical protein